MGAASCQFLLNCCHWLPCGCLQALRHFWGCKPRDYLTCPTSHQALGAITRLTEEPDTVGYKVLIPAQASVSRHGGPGSPAGSEWQQAASSACQKTYIIQAKY